MNYQFTVVMYGAIPLDVRSDPERAKEHVRNYIASVMNNDASRIVFDSADCCPYRKAASIAYHFDGPNYHGTPHHVCELYHGHLAIRPYTQDDAIADGIPWNVAA